MFDWLDGTVVDLDDGDAALGQFETLGAISARMHRMFVSGTLRGPATSRVHDFSIGPSSSMGRVAEEASAMGPEVLRSSSTLDATIKHRAWSTLARTPVASA